MFVKGSIVRHTREFLQNTQWYAGVPIDGKVGGPGGLRNTVKVQWHDQEDEVLVNVANLELYGDQPERIAVHLDTLPIGGALDKTLCGEAVSVPAREITTEINDVTCDLCFVKHEALTEE